LKPKYNKNKSPNSIIIPTTLLKTTYFLYSFDDFPNGIRSPFKYLIQNSNKNTFSQQQYSILPLEITRFMNKREFFVKKRMFVIMTICLMTIPSMGFAQENISTREAGAYQRRSVAFLDVVAYKNRELTNRQWADYLVSAIQDTVRMARFDYNVISRRVVDDFLDMPRSMSIEERMNATVVPAILTAVEAEKELRAVAMLSEQQRNSFITDKARELGVTEAELNAVMNSAYIFVPVYVGHETGRTRDGEHIIELTAGGYWWKIDNTGEVPEARLILRVERTKRVSDPDLNRAFRAAVDLIAMDVQIATRELPEFQLSAQILSRTARSVEISIGKREGVVVDDKYRIYESIEDHSGNITERRRGWVMIDKVQKETEASQSRAQIIAGAPYIGATVREIPHLPFDVSLQFVSVPYNIKKDGNDGGLGRFEDLSMSNMYGPRLKVGANMANLFKATDFGVSQLWLNISGEYLWGSASGSCIYGDFKYAESFGGELSLAKKWYIRRFAVAPEIGAGFKKVLLLTDDVYSWIIQYAVSKFTIGAFANVGAELALAPLVNIGGFIGVNAYSGGNSWDLSYYDRGSSSWKSYWDPSLNSGDYRLNAVGVSWGAYFTMAIPSGTKK
jgi:hypothetical protein